MGSKPVLQGESQSIFVRAGDYFKPWEMTAKNEEYNRMDVEVLRHDGWGRGPKDENYNRKDEYYNRKDEYYNRKDGYCNRKDEYCNKKDKDYTMDDWLGYMDTPPQSFFCAHAGPTPKIKNRKRTYRQYFFLQFLFSRQPVK
jgi:hypothetical protein